MKKLIVWDFDGTLFDTAPGIIATLREMEKQEGLTPLSDDTIRSFIGPPLEDSMMRYGVDEAGAQRLGEIYRRIYMETGLRAACPYPHIREILALTRAAGSVSAIATLKKRAIALRTLELNAMTADFACVEGPESGADRPTKAELIARAMRRCGASPARTLMLGDSPYDGEGAREAGVDFVAVCFGFGFAAPGALAGIPYVFRADTPEQLLDYFRGQA